MISKVKLINLSKNDSLNNLLRRRKQWHRVVKVFEDHLLSGLKSRFINLEPPIPGHPLKILMI